MNILAFQVEFHTFPLIIVPAVIVVADLVAMALYLWRYKKRNQSLQGFSSTAFWKIALYILFAFAFFLLVMLTNAIILTSWSNSWK